MEFKESQTAKNLQKALIGESIAQNRYYYFAEKSREYGDEEVAQAFEQMALNERMHAQFWYDILHSLPSDTVGCLMQAAENEYREWRTMYPKFAETARAEGFEQIASMMDKVASIERVHENRFLTMIAKLNRTDPADVQAPAYTERSEQKRREKKVGYRCQFCGAIVPERQPACDVCHAIGAYELVEYYE